MLKRLSVDSQAYQTVPWFYYRTIMPETAPTSIFQGPDIGFPPSLYGEPSAEPSPAELAQSVEQQPQPTGPESNIVMLGRNAEVDSYAHNIANNIQPIRRAPSQGMESLRPAA